MSIPSDSPRRRSSSPSAVRRLVLGLTLLLWTGWAPPAAAERWVRPVSAEVARPFSLGAKPFARGQHRGVDLAARTGASVRSACSGVVVFVGVVPRMGRVVSVRCGRWRVSYLPLATAWVRRGSVVAAQTRLGKVGNGHGGLHVGVRREGRRFGYVDPLTRFGADQPPPVAVRPPRLGPAPRPSKPRPLPALRSAPVPVPGFAAAPQPATALQPATAPRPSLAPWSSWLGLTLLLASAVGGRTVVRQRARRRAPTAAAASVP